LTAGPRRAAAGTLGTICRLRLVLKLSAVLIGIALALAAAGCGGDDEEPQAKGRVPAKVVSSTAVRGGSQRERALLQTTLRGMQKTTLARVVIGSPAARRGNDAAVPVAFTHVPGGPTVRRQWDEWIVAGAFSRRLEAAGLPAEVSGTAPRGAFVARPKLPKKPDPQPLGRGRETTILKAIRRAATRSGGKVAGLEVHRPYGVAVALSLATDDPATFLKKQLRPLMARLDNNRQQLEGLYLAVLDERRLLALEWGTWTRNPAGLYWVRHDLANCSPIRQSGPPGADPPPACPA
jgi:hypothetical protein